MKSRWKLMSDEALSQDDRIAMSNCIVSSNIVTQGERVREFEKLWSEWLGVKYSVYVNSGSSANLLLVQACKNLKGKGSSIAQSLTWSTNISPIVTQDLGPLHLVDCNLKNLGPDYDKLKEKIVKEKPKYLFLTHVLGFPALKKDLLDFCNEHGVTVIEDCCESHGAMFDDNQKIGCQGYGSSFSFYFGHHITTVEGGMICTNDEELYHHLLLLRSHGLMRELPEEERKLIPECDPRFTFLECGFNVRNTDIHATVGIRQIDRLTHAIEKRNENLNRFLSNLDKEKYHTDFDTTGISSFALPLIVKGSAENRKIVEEDLNNNLIDSRPLIAGNICKHPMLRSVNMSCVTPNSDYINSNALYVGNSEFVTASMVDSLVDVLNRSDLK